MTNGSLPRDKKAAKDTSDSSDGSLGRVVQSPRTKIRTTCNYAINKPPVPRRKPLVFPHSGKNPGCYQYYSLEESSNVEEESQESSNYLEYHSQLLLLSSLKKQLEDLKAKEIEEKSEEEMERSLLNAEFDHISSNLADLRSRCAELRSHYGQMTAGKHDFNLSEVKRNLRESNAKIVFIQSCLQRLRSSDSDPGLIAKHQEQLDHEKKKYEDLEFQLMEGEAHTETEKEEMLQEIRFFEKEISAHEEKLNEIDMIQTQLLSNEFRNKQEIELLKKSLNRSIQEESEKLVELSNYDETISASSSETEMETKDQQELLRKTQRELDQIYSTTESIMSTSSRLSKSLSRDSQQLFLASNEPILRNSVLIAIENESSESSPDKDSEVSQQNPFSEVSSGDDSATSRSSPDYASIVKLRAKSIEREKRPLTRYLPMTGQDLDLKAHIESAGHQLDLCKHIFITSNSCQGYLQKLTTGKFRNSWHKRWFFFDRQEKRLSYGDKHQLAEKGTHIPFKDIEDVYVDHSWKNSKNVIFCVKTSQRAFTLMAPSSETMRIWVDVVFTGAEGHPIIY